MRHVSDGLSKITKKKERCYPLPWKRRVISTECCSEKRREWEGTWFCACGMLAGFQGMSNERRTRRWSNSSRFQVSLHADNNSSCAHSKFHYWIWIRNLQLVALEKGVMQIFLSAALLRPPSVKKKAPLHVKTGTGTGKLGSAVGPAHADTVPLVLRMYLSIC